MIDLVKGTLKVAELPEEPILRWEVWFVTTEGTFAQLSGAIESCERTGQPIHLIIPVPVACGKTTYEIAVRY